MRARGALGGMVMAAATLASLSAYAPAASAASNTAKDRRVERPVSLAAPGILGSFTPAAANPWSGATGSRNATVGSFRFTPAGSTTPKKDVMVAVRSRISDRPEATRVELTPSAQDFGLSVGWRGLSVSGDVGEVDGGLLPFKRKSVDLGLSYSAKNWRTTLQVGEEDQSLSYRLPNELSDKRYSFGLGGAYSVSRNLSVTGGVRYQVRPELPTTPASERDGQAVYVGTSLAF